MKMCRLWMVVFFLLLLMPSVSFAEKLDGSKPLLCSIIEVIECSPGRDCIHSDAASVNLPYFVNADVPEKVLRVPRVEENERTSQIKYITRHLDGKLILQGVEDGSRLEDDAIGWTMSIDEDDGRMIFSASREKAGFIIFGACTTP